MSEFEAECPSCGHRLRLPVTYAGKSGKCPKCRETIQLPEASGARSPALDTEVPAAPVDDAPERPCPICGERIKVAARKCRHCGEFLDPSLRRRDAAARAGPPAPLVLRIWGIGVMALNGLMLALQLLQSVGLMLFLVSTAGPARGGVAAALGFSVLIGVVVCGVFIRLGWGLYKGQRSAVIGMCVFFALGLGVTAFVAASASLVEAGILGSFVVVLHLPPVGVGIIRWRELT